MMRSARPKTKVVVRNLPFNLTEQDFRNLIQDHLPGVDYFHYFPGKKGTVGSIPSRAFIHFTDADKMYLFAEKMDGHKFVDGKGLSINCSVELSLSQRWTDPSNRRDKPDKTIATIDQDEVYTQFLEALKAPPAPPKEEPVTPNPNPNDLSKPMSTPILDELRKKAALKQQQQQDKQTKQKDKREKQKQKRERGGKKGAAQGPATPAGTSGGQAKAAAPAGPIRIVQKPAGSVSSDGSASSVMVASDPTPDAAAAPASTAPAATGKNANRQKGRENRRNRGGGGKGGRGGNAQASAAAPASAPAPAPAVTPKPTFVPKSNGPSASAPEFIPAALRAPE